jgi:hypothetical protein
LGLPLNHALVFPRLPGTLVGQYAGYNFKTEATDDFEKLLL